MGHDVAEDQEKSSWTALKLLDRGFHLREEDELLVETVLNRDSYMEDINPFDPYLESSSISHQESGDGSVYSLEELDNKLMDLALDHDWNDCNSMMDTSTLGSVTTRRCIPEVAMTVKRLGAASREKDHRLRKHRQVCATLSAISEDVEDHSTDCGETTNASESASSVDVSRSVRHRRQRQHGRDYLTEMREERDLVRLYVSRFQLNGLHMDIMDIRNAIHMLPGLTQLTKSSEA